MDTLAASVLKMLADDAKDDLYFEGGLVRTKFLQLAGQGVVSAALLERLLHVSGEGHQKLWEELLEAAFGAFRGFKFTDDLHLLEGKLSTLAMLSSVPTLVAAISASLLRDVLLINGLSPDGRALPPPSAAAFERACLIAPLLSVSCMTDIAAAVRAAPGDRASGPGPDCLHDIRGYPANRGGAEPQLKAMEHVMSRTQHAAHAIFKRVAQAKGAPGPPGVGKEVVLAWLSAVCTLSEGRLDGGEKAVLHGSNLTKGCSDAFMLGVTSVALRFLTPVLEKFEKAPGDVLCHVGLEKWAQCRHRLGSLPSEPVLGIRVVDNASEDAQPHAGAAQGAAAPAAAEAQKRSGLHSLTAVLGDSAYSAPHFMAECFVAAARAVHVGLLPAVHRQQCLMQRLSQQLSFHSSEQGRPPPGSLAEAELHFLHTHADCTTTALLQDDLAMTTIRFLALVLTVLLATLRAPDAPSRLSHVPESLARDALNYAAFAVNTGAMDLLGSVSQLGTVMEALAELLRSAAVASAMTRNSVVDLLCAMLRSQIGSGRGGSLAQPRMRPGAAALVEAVLRTVSSSGVVPALMTAYTTASVVEGLDVDKYHFDKFTMRHNIDLVLEELWRDAQCREDLVRMASSTGPMRALLADFLQALLDDLSYLLDDSMDRLVDIKTIADAQKDAAKWGALNPQERETKENFKAGQASTARGFLSMAVTTLRMLTFVAEHPTISGIFLQEPLTPHAAHLCLHHLEMLAGPRAESLNIDNAAEFRWKPGELLTSIVQLALQLSRQREFVEVLAMEQDYNADIMTAALHIIREREVTHHLAGRLGDRLEELIGSAESIRAARLAAVPKEQNPVDAALALTLDGELEAAAVDATYKSELAELSVGTFDSNAPAGYNSELQKRSAQVAADTAAKMKRLAREFRSMRKGGELPLGAAAAVFVRHDEDRVDKVRALITGPEGTPYAGGCFFFDVLFPADYPNTAPLMLFETTGQGRVRFNPNLYADGKVCLSLLGTWHGSEEEKWNPVKSTLWQVLVSIQAMILVEDPYFNEPNVEHMRYQEEGAALSKKRNAALQLETIRWAMIDVLKRPRPGFEAATRSHFRLLRTRLLRQCQGWLRDCHDQGELLQLRMAEAICELNALLAAL